MKRRTLICEVLICSLIVCSCGFRAKEDVAVDEGDYITLKSDGLPVR